MPRIKFTFLHTFISVVVFSLLTAVVFFVWYPYPLYKATDVFHIFLIILLVDIVVGPLLGFIVYNPKKKSLKFDLTIVFILQIMAMFYGVYSVSNARPIWIVYNVDRFDLIRNNDVENNKLNWFGPKYKAVKLSNNIEERNKDTFNEIIGGVSLTQQPSRYVDLNQVKNEIQSRAKPINDLNKYNPKNAVIAHTKNYHEADAWVPLKANAVDMVVLMNKKEGKVIAIVDLRPW